MYLKVAESFDKDDPMLRSLPLMWARCSFYINSIYKNKSTTEYKKYANGNHLTLSALAALVGQTISIFSPSSECCYAP
eukprot:1010850-Pleurochrysis_carterae.AAC.1